MESGANKSCALPCEGVGRESHHPIRSKFSVASKEDQSINFFQRYGFRSTGRRKYRWFSGNDRFRETRVGIKFRFVSS